MKEKSTDFVTPTKASGEAQEEEISPTILEAGKTLSKVASQGVSKEKSTDKGKRYMRRARSMAKKIDTGLDAEEEINTGREKVNNGIEEVSTGSTKVDSEDWDAIRSKLKANTELLKDVLGQDLPEQDFAKRMAEMVNQRQKHFAEEKAKAKRNKPMTQSQLRIYMSNYLKNQGTWKLSQLKKLKFKEIKEEFDNKGRRDSKKNRKKKKQKARKGVNVDKSAQEDSDTDKEESVEAMNPTHLTTKSDIVANWKIFQQDFTKEDLIELYRLVMHKYGTNRPEDVYDRVLWSYLKTMFDPPLIEDAIWSLPLQQKMLSLLTQKLVRDLSKATNPLQAKELLQIKEMADQDTPPPTITAMKIPIIKKGEYDIWSMRMRQYICHTDHNLWDIIVNGDLEDEATPSGEQSSPPVPKTAKQLAARRNQERIKSILLLAIPDEYLLKFHNVPDAKSLWAAIKSRFGGNEESKKMQKNVLKHQFENFVTASNETLDKAYDRFQKLISQLEIHGAYVSKEDINQKFLRSLPPSWSQIALIMRNKPDIDEVDIDDLYNNLRVYEDELKRSSGSNSASQNLAFLSSENTNSTNEVSTASGDFGVSTAGGINQVPSTPSAHDIAYSFLAQPTTSPQLENEDFQQMDGDDLEELDLRWQVAMLTVRVKKKGHFARECRSGRSQGRRPYGDNGRSNAQTTESSSQALVAQDGLGGYDWSNDFEGNASQRQRIVKSALLLTTAKTWNLRSEYRLCDAKGSPWKGPCSVLGTRVLGGFAFGYMVGPFEILERIGPIAYRLRLSEELCGVHDTFHVSNLKKCLADASLHVPLDEIKVEKTLRFVKEPVEIMDREVKSLNVVRVPLAVVYTFYKGLCVRGWIGFLAGFVFDMNGEVATYVLEGESKIKTIKRKDTAAQSEAFKQENVLAERLHGLDQQMERKRDESLYFMDRIWVLLVGSVMDEAHASRFQDVKLARIYIDEIIHPQADGQSERMIQTLEDIMWACDIDFGGSYQLSIRCAPFKALYGRKCRSLVLWAEIGGSSLIGPELVQETTDKVVVIKETLQAARDSQKSYADNMRKPLEFEVGDRVMLKVSPWKGVVHFGKKAYRLRLSEELSGVHDTFHVSNLKKCLADASLHVPLDEIKVDKTLRFVEEPVEIMDREVKSLKRSRIPLVKVR
ncbi:hypothetical protein Tco_0500341 [Tanacetum coccineum]